MKEHIENIEPHSIKLRWYQYRLRSLLLSVLIVAVVLSIWRTIIYPYQVQSQINRIASGDCEYYWGTMIGANLSGVDMNESIMDKIVQIPQLKWLIVGGHSFTDRDLVRLETLPDLKFLLLDSTKTSSEAETKLQKSLPKLKIHKSTWRAAAELLLKYKKELP